VIGIIANYKEIVNTPGRRQVLTSITDGQLLVQLSSLPVTLAMPSMARVTGRLETAGTYIFNTVNKAVVMSGLPTEHRGFASRMLETTRDLGHAAGTTISSIILAMVLPVGVASVVANEDQSFYAKGFQTASFGVVGIMITGAIIAAFHQAYGPAEDRSRGQATLAATDD